MNIFMAFIKDVLILEPSLINEQAQAKAVIIYNETSSDEV